MREKQEDNEKKSQQKNSKKWETLDYHVLYLNIFFLDFSEMTERQKNGGKEDLPLRGQRHMRLQNKTDSLIGPRNTSTSLFECRSSYCLLAEEIGYKFFRNFFLQKLSIGDLKQYV